MARNSLKNVIRLIDQTKQDLPPESAFLTDLKRSMELTDNKNRTTPSKTYKPSSMNCIRNMYYQVTGKEPDSRDSNYTLIGICNCGTDIHERVQTAVSQMQENGMECEYIDVATFIKNREIKDVQVKSKSGMETKLYHTTLNMSFMCDGIIKYKNHYYILELKTESSSKFFTRTGVDMAHYNQGTAYSMALGLDEVIFVYINRDIFDMKSFMFNVTDDMKNELLGKIEDCDEYVKRKITPPVPAEVARKTCEYCNYKQTCKKDVC